MKLGAFSISLSVQNLEASIAFYAKLGFEVFVDMRAHKYAILKNGNALVGLFEGMFEGNVLTFNPGWDENAQEVNPFDDVRAIQKSCEDQGLTIINPADLNGSGPGSFMVMDPDGNMVLVDQHR